MIKIRKETEKDYKIVDNLVRESFWNVYRPGALEHYLIHLMREDAKYEKDLSFVMEKDGEVIGQAVLYPAEIKKDDGNKLPIYTLGPICIANEYKRKGFGKMLLDFCLERAKEHGIPALCFEGNYLFYSTCGFTYARNFHLRYHGLPEGEDDSFFLAIELQKGYFDGVSGTYSTPEVYLVDREKAEEFDKQFPPKEKLKLPGQLE